MQVEEYTSRSISLYEGESKDNPTKVYCCDAATSVLPQNADRIQYRRLTLENAGYYSAENAEKIRAITKLPILS